MKKQAIRGIHSISSLEGLKPGDTFLEVSTQFKCCNKINLIEMDTTGLNRDIAYFQYADSPKYPYPFGIWGHELNTSRILFPYIF